MAAKQRSILRERSLTGKSLHTGEAVKLTLKPAEVNAGIVFRRLDLFGKPEIRPKFSNATDFVRSTTISEGNAKVHTIEHIMSALAGCGVDNAVVELDAREPPILDGSARPFVNLVQESEPVDQEADRESLCYPQCTDYSHYIPWCYV